MYSQYGHIALHVAAVKGHLEVTKLLLKNGANIDIRGPGACFQVSQNMSTSS